MQKKSYEKLVIFGVFIDMESKSKTVCTSRTTCLDQASQIKVIVKWTHTLLS